MSIGLVLWNAVIALASVAGLIFVAVAVYRQVTEGVAKTIEKEHRERDEKNFKKSFSG